MSARANLIFITLAWMAFFAGGSAHGQTHAAADAARLGEEIIVTIRSNDVPRGEFTVLQVASGDFWVLGEDLQRLKVEPQERARRSVAGASYYSLRDLGATVAFDEATLALGITFPADQLQSNRLDLSRRPAPLPVVPPLPSAILNYRAAVRQVAEDAPVQLRLATDLNLRLGEVLLRQEAKVETGRDAPAFARGRTQLIWDDRLAGRRVIAGDQLTAGGGFGTIFPGGGVSISRLFGMTPDVLRQPTASFQVSAATPSQVEVAVDGSTVYRATVPPGPVDLENLYYYGGSRSVRVTLTDASGRREVHEQPFFFTDALLAQGVQEYSYFIGRRAELGLDDRWHYRENAWQGFHRYGVSNWATLEASAEGSPGFTSGGAGITLRHEKAGLLSLGMLASLDHETDLSARGWSARYAYVSPHVTLFAARRQMGSGFRSFGTTATATGLFSETRVGASTLLARGASLTGDYSRVKETTGVRSSYALRLASSLSRQITLYTEYSVDRRAHERDWAFNLYLRYDFERQQWAGSNVRTSRGLQEFDLEAGKQLEQGEGFGYRIGTTVSRRDGVPSDFAHGSATLNLRQASIDFNGSAQTRGGNARYAEIGLNGALVSLDGYVGASRVVNDSFALARLGVPQAGVDVFLNNQNQGKTDSRGELLIPNVGAFGRQNVSLNDKQLSLEYNLARQRVTIAPAYRSGSVVEFGGRKLRAAAGAAWLVQDDRRTAVQSRSWGMAGPAGRLRIETTESGEFYLDEAPPGRYTGTLEIDGRIYRCRMDVPAFEEAVHELQGGLLCE